ncbi:putative cytochrome P450 phenylacetate 2-hydroxylase [Tothia fuscella]|uniref:Cytochrome P450 phenylacetate 2-hydroxylase n=1 Tax=Tothia fuscella TaxID=1048955 RepID=A0A9P4TXI0_9PEZI|nr:putative cytochrome P450 phenylacetate 2-hydroxylase [Tothia fuscella]
MTSPIIGIAILSIAYLLWKWAYATDLPKIKGIPEIPGWPLFGSLIEMGEYHAKVAQKWAEKYGPVFQVRLGNRRIVFANSFDSVKHFWITHQSALISRPTLHTFHTLVSDSSNFTIGTSPWDESCKRRRKAAATALNVPATRSYMPLVDLESTTSIKELLHDSKYGKIDIDPSAYFQRYALNTSLTLNYGTRIEGNVDDAMLKEITAVERGVSNFRSTSNNWEDYVPLLRWIPKKKEGGPLEFKARRAKYMKYLLDELKKKIEMGTDKPCITGNVLKDPEAKLSAEMPAEIDSICLTMVSAGLDTIPGNLIMGLAFLSTPSGAAVQQKAYNEIKSVYPNNDAWFKCLEEEKLPYVVAFYKEVLRYWTVIPICLPRVSIKDIEYNGAIIPAGTTFYMNAYAADYDESHFKDPYKFMPERYLDSDSSGGISHYAYGAGSRMCAGSHLANRELYVAFVRLLSAFEIVPSKEVGDRPIMDALMANDIPTSLTMEPKKFKCGFRVRDRDVLERWIGESEKATKDL